MEAHSESGRTSAAELFCGNNQRVKAVGYFPRRNLSWMFDRILIATLPNKSLELEEGLRKLSTTGVTQGNLGLPVAPNSLDLHQTQKKTR